MVYWGSSVQSSTDPFLKRRLTLYNQQVMQPITALKLELNIDPTNERKMTLAILKANKTLNFSFDISMYKLTDINE